jgi:hypothetical protein
MGSDPRDEVVQVNDEPIGQAGGLGAMLVIASILALAAALRRVRGRLGECHQRWTGRVGR